MRKIVDIFVVSLLLGGVAIGVAWLGKGLQEDYSGKVYVIDGDTVILDQEKIRLEGIDAPEIGQICTRDGVDYQCGELSKAHLRKLIAGGEFHCLAWQRDKYDRLLGECFAGNENINQKMVADGWALSFGGYFREEKQARQRNNGMWKGKFQRPVDWRQVRGSVIELPHETGRDEWWKFW